MEVLRAVEARDSSGACCKLYLLFMTAGSPVGYSALSAVVGTPYVLPCRMTRRRMPHWPERCEFPSPQPAAYLGLMFSDHIENSR